MHSETAVTEARVAFDAVALKPEECDVRDALDISIPRVVVDYEGRAAFPDRGTLADLAAAKDVRVTTPVRADGFDPRGDDALDRDIPEGVGRVLVAGHAAYLTDAERARAVAPRLGDATGRHPDAWVGTEGVERVALATGAPQFELLSRTTERDVRALRAAGYTGDIAVYAPTVLTDDEDAVLDAVGAYAARRGPVNRALPDDAATDGDAAGRAREVLSKAVRDYALVGNAATVSERVDALREAGVDHVVAYPARGLDDLV
ncbi:DUF7388 family protein [Halocalculus aciditolerans]|uniref:Luciferase n=1 Tax=Halocalculus aciditolerans TaxID=1383812 RepID=A0A830FP39_9EURY|nr:luciferase [Halocalculus aciditolerans]GGL72481.1 luciferase [Halocalculus aciditolerans]